MLWSELTCRLSIWQWTNLQAHEVLILLVSGLFSVCLFPHLSSFGLKKKSTCERLYMVLIKNSIWPTKITSVIYGCSCQVCVHPNTVTMYAIHIPYHEYMCTKLNGQEKCCGHCSATAFCGFNNLGFSVAPCLYQLIMGNTDFPFWQKIQQIFQNQGIFLCALYL